ncbi:MAG: hypothetical protein GY811_18535 [Myxococcales bacterium]|nr:hypothetical protein [Myxococcales bacterium]
MSDHDKPEGPDDDGWGAAADTTPKDIDTPAQPPASGESEESATDAVPIEAEQIAKPDESIRVSDMGELGDVGASELGDDSASELGDVLGAVSAVDEDAPQWAPPVEPDKSLDEQPLPAPSSDMLAAAGVIAKRNSAPKTKKQKPKKERPTGPGLARKQKIKLIAGAVLLVMAGVGAILGWLNNQNYYLVCGTKSIRAEQGRFWPTGQKSLPGPSFRPILVPSSALCQSQSFEDRADLETAFLGALLEQSTKLLTTGGVEQVSNAEKQLEQALLLTRDPQRAAERELAEHLKGDVAYWRGASEVERAVERLLTGATEFEDAATKRPRHSSDASSWAEHARYIAEEIDKGPRSLRKDEAPKEKPHFEGLPQADDREKPTGAPHPDVAAESSNIDAGVPTESPADADIPPVDAALPTGGVLL